MTKSEFGVGRRKPARSCGFTLSASAVVAFGICFAALASWSQPAYAQNADSSSTSLDWHLVSIATTPGARLGHGMVYDSTRNKVIMFGGEMMADWNGTADLLENEEAMLNDLWEWDPVTEVWNEITPASTLVPGRRSFFGMAYDPLRGKVVIYGGRTLHGTRADTWEWDPSTRMWSEPNPDDAVPGGVRGLQLAFDPNLQRVILFGGQAYWGGQNGVTFAWDSVNAHWDVVASTGPAPRTGPGMSTDYARSRVVLYGGYDYTANNYAGVIYGDTWEWDGVAWIQVAASGPSPRMQLAQAYDLSRQVTIVYGGTDASCFNCRKDTWEWDGSVWQQRLTPTDMGGRETATAYDGTGILTFGGVDSRFNLYSDTHRLMTNPLEVHCATPDRGWHSSDVSVPCTATGALANASDASFNLTTDVPSGVETSDASTNSREVCDPAGTCITAGPISGIKIDKKAPTISVAATASPNGHGWYNANVTLHFACDDAGSGVPAGACPPDTVLTTEGTAVTSAAQTVTDAAGNISAPSNVVTVKIDKAPPVLNPVVNPNPVLLGGTATASAVAGDALSGVASQSCAPVATGSVGPKSVTCTATDNAGNTATKAASYGVIYRFDGFLQPVNDTAHQTCPSCPTSIFKGGSTVPVKFALRDANGNIVLGAGTALWIAPQQGGATNAAIDEGVYGDPATPGAAYQLSGSQYIYNWSTKGYATNYFWRIGVALDDGQTYICLHWVEVGL